MKNLSKIKVIGVGGAGSNAVSRMKKVKIRGVELISVNTDVQDLRKADSDVKIQIGIQTTLGLGSGMDPEIGRKSAEEQREDIKAALNGAELVFITCGLGGGTGTGAGPVIAGEAKNLGALTIGVVTKPFAFEGIYRRKVADAVEKLFKEKVDTLIVIENDKLLDNLDKKASVSSAFWFSDDVLRQAVQGITDLISLPGLINVDFASVKTIMKNSGTAILGIGRAKGEKRAETAVKEALNSPLLNVSPKGARGVLFNVSGADVSLVEIEEIGKLISQETNPRAKVIFGAVQSEKLKEGEIKVTVIATGF